MNTSAQQLANMISNAGAVMTNGRGLISISPQASLVSFLSTQLSSSTCTYICTELSDAHKSKLPSTLASYRETVETKKVRRNETPVFRGSVLLVVSKRNQYHFFEILFRSIYQAKKKRQKYFIVRHKNTFPIKSMRKS